MAWRTRSSLCSANWPTCETTTTCSLPSTMTYSSRRRSNWWTCSRCRVDWTMASAMSAGGARRSVWPAKKRSTQTWLGRSHSKIPAMWSANSSASTSEGGSSQRSSARQRICSSEGPLVAMALSDILSPAPLAAVRELLHGELDGLGGDLVAVGIVVAVLPADDVGSDEVPAVDLGLAVGRQRDDGSVAAVDRLAAAVGDLVEPLVHCRIGGVALGEDDVAVVGRAEQLVDLLVQAALAVLEDLGFALEAAASAEGVVALHAVDLDLEERDQAGIFARSGLPLHGDPFTAPRQRLRPELARRSRRALASTGGCGR